MKVTINFRKKISKKGRKNRFNRFEILKSWERVVPDLKAAESQAERMLPKIKGATDFVIHEEE